MSRTLSRISEYGHESCGVIGSIEPNPSVENLLVVVADPIVEIAHGVDAAHQSLQSNVGEKNRLGILPLS
jgi:hypothetical protein